MSASCISSKFNPYIPDETKIPINNLYNRFMFPIKFDKHGDILLFKGTLSILEGFYFENDCVDKIIVDFNGNRLEFFKNRDYFLNSFPILYDCLSYTQIIFEFYKNGKLVDITNQNGKMIGGFLPKTINCDYCFINDIRNSIFPKRQLCFAYYDGKLRVLIHLFRRFYIHPFKKLIVSLKLLNLIK